MIFVFLNYVHDSRSDSWFHDLICVFSYQNRNHKWQAFKFANRGFIFSWTLAMAPDPALWLQGLNFESKIRIGITNDRHLNDEKFAVLNNHDSSTYRHVGLLFQSLTLTLSYFFDVFIVYFRILLNKLLRKCLRYVEI